MSLRHALLGLLSLQPMSGYDLKKAIDASVTHFWTADQSQVYRALSGLVTDGLVERSTIEQSDRPNRHLHTITAAGLAELDAWIRSPLDPELAREPFLARLFFADRLGDAAVLDLLAARRAVVRATLEELSAIEVPAVSASLTRGELLRIATLGNGLAHARAELEWIDELADRLRGSTR